MLQDILEYNKKFVEEKKYEQYAADKYPSPPLSALRTATLRSSRTPEALSPTRSEA